MKKTLAFSLVLCLLISLTACAANPNSDIVINKNDGSFDANLVHSATEDKDPNATQNLVYTDDFYSTDGSVQYVFNINNTIADCNMPVVEVIPHFLTGADAKRVATVLFGDAVFYEQEPLFAPQYSQAQIMEKVSRWSEYISIDSIIALYGDNLEDPATVANTVKGFVQNYNELYGTAPKENPHTICDWTMKKDSYYYESADDLAGHDLSKDNDAIMAVTQIDGVEYTFSVSSRNQDDYKINTITVALGSGISPENIDIRIYQASLCRTDKPTDEQMTNISEKAYQMLEEMQLGDWAIESCTVKTTYYGNIPEYIVCVHAVPVFNGVEVIRRPQIGNLKSETAYASNYYLTDAEFGFSVNGDLISFEMYSPVDVSSVVNENVAVMDADSLLERAKTNLELTDYYSYVSSDWIESIQEEMLCVVNVTEIDYNLTRVKAPNTDDSYYYVPAIVLYGTVEYRGKESGIVQEIDSDYEPYTLLILNAVDGSVIQTGNE